MKGSTEVIELLNDVLTAELTAINQYFVDSKMLANWGYAKLADHFREDSIDEMRDAEKLVDRILFLDGVPNLQRMGTVRVGETPAEKLELALSVEIEAVERLNAAVARCLAIGDSGSRDLFAEILRGEEEHADWLETQLSLVRALGEQAYLAEQLA